MAFRHRKLSAGSDDQVYHVPGYTGHIPGRKFTEGGETLGNESNAILTNEADSRAQIARTVLGRDTKTLVALPLTKLEVDAASSSRALAVQKTIPAGYTGYVPRSKDAIGQTYSETRVLAYQKFRAQQEHESEKEHALHSTMSDQRRKSLTNQ